MLIDMHAHSSGISRCCLIDAKAVVEEAVKVGLDGIVLTNHYVEYYTKNKDYLGLANRYVEEFYYAKKCGDEIGCKVFFGIEVTMEVEGFPHFLIYGVNPQFILEHPQIVFYSQEKLYKAVKSAGGVLVQAHPFRKNENKLLDLDLLDGVEINCHPLYEGTHLDKLKKIAESKNFLLTCGGDYHADTHRVKCGMYLPDWLQNGVDVGSYLLQTKECRLCVQEVGELSVKEVLHSIKHI